MKKSLVFLSIIFLFVQFQNVDAQKKRPVPKSKVLSAREIANKVLPSVVLIITQDENGKPMNQGSGFVYKPGLVVSNLHVFERATNAIVKNVTTGETSRAVEVIAIDALVDICIIRIENTKFAPLPLGDSNSIQTGDEIYVASNPKGLEGTFTKGIISSLRSDLGLFQLDAAISSGSSGGVLLNSKAEAVGIIKSSLVAGQNLNFAIPINKLKLLRNRFRHPIVLAGSCSYPARIEAKLNGAVKRIDETYSFDPISGAKPVVNTITKYDLAGNEIEEISYEEDGSFRNKSVIVFDESGLMVSAIHSFVGELDESVSFNFEDSVKRKIDFRKFSNKLGAFTYNSAGERVELVASFFTSKSKFDSVGREIERTDSNKNGEVESSTRFRYKDDIYGNWIERLEYANYPSVDDRWNLRRATRRSIEYYH